MRALHRALSRLRIAALVLTVWRPAVAEPPPRTQAKEVYERAVEAHKHGDYQLAAREFARADSLAPSAAALKAGLESAIQVDDAVIGADLIERSRREPTNGALQPLIDAAKKKFSGRAGRLRVTCPTSCLVTLDGIGIDTGRPVWAKAGRHTIVLQVDGDAQTKLIDLAADTAPLEITPASKSTPKHEEPKAVVTPEEPRRGALRSPVVFWIGAVTTAALAGAGVGLGLSAKSSYDDFAAQGCESVVTPGCTDKKDEGESRQLIANVLFISAGVAGVATAFVGLVITDWRKRSTTGSGLSPIVSATGAGLGYTSRF